MSWKKLQGDVFRKPEFCPIFCIMFGNGLQIFMTVYLILIFLSVGLISSNARYFAIYNSLFYLFSGGFVNGYFTSRLMKYFGSTEWRFTATLTALCLPIYIVSTFLIVDIIEYFEKSN